MPADGVELIYVSDKEPGYTRTRLADGFRYRRPDGTLLKDPKVIARIEALGLPPAYERVWICLNESGHLQATGYDVRGRKQYRYHEQWQQMRSQEKFDQLSVFARTLPRIRRKIRRHMDGPVDDVTTVLAALVALLDQAPLRIGNATYVEENGTYGAATLLKRHLRVNSGYIELNFKGKGGRRIRRRLRNPRLQRVLEEISDLPGRQLFVSVSSDGKTQPIDSGRFNRYLADMSEAPISAKTFRTWAGSVAAFAVARQALSEGLRPTIKDMCEAAAEVLHNTKAVCRKSYVHPAVLALANGTGAVASGKHRNAKPVAGLRVDETQLLRFLENGKARKAPTPCN
ncbi:MAG TPA: DNA topoisomerase IB [Ensifer sp.]|jgi:DNA topoisomerase-1|uniref:DNA topoisomerase IB n=1 Tax=Ensifer sp. TaxID=1872086 RepID=UPI002E14DAB0|nr:DNA topoisomerase IB [Ensifer sp.]